MKRIVIASHSYLAEGMKKTVEFILGERQNISVMTAYIEEDFEIEEEIEKLFTELTDEDELIVVADILGGSVSNAFAQFLIKEKFYLISGMNLPLLLELITHLDGDMTLAIQKGVEAGKSGVQLVNELFREEEL